MGRVSRVIISCIIIISATLTGCGKQVVTIDENENVNNNTKVISLSDIKSRYREDITGGIMPMYNVDGDQQFTFIFNSAIVSGTKAVSVHTDEKCLQESEIAVGVGEYNTETKQTKIVVSPPADNPPLSKEINGKGNIKTGKWGGAPIYYIKISYDMESSDVKKLNTPNIVPFTIESKYDIPNLKYELSEGQISLTWDKISNATSYNVYRSNKVNVAGSSKTISGAENAYDGYSIELIDNVKDTKWSNFSIGGNTYAGVKDIGDSVTHQNVDVGADYFISAVYGDTESSLSRPINTFGIGYELPIEAEGLWGSTFKTFAELPDSVDVTFIDGFKRNMPIVYSNKIKTRNNDSTIVNYSIQGTKLKGEIYVSKDATDKDKLDTSDNSNIKITAGSLTVENKTPRLPNINTRTVFNDEDTGLNIVEQQILSTKQSVGTAMLEKLEIDKDISINASSAFEEYVAIKLINCSNIISLSAFPSCQSYDIINGTVNQAIYQNPLIMGVKSFRYDYDKLVIYVEYEEDTTVIKEKQQELLKEAKRVIGGILTEDMGIAEKHKAIYDYVSNNTKFDDMAYENLRLNNYKSTDNQFNDSKTAYGLLVNKQGIGSAYASAYKMLAYTAEIPTYVIAGKLNNIPHVWNKVQIDNEWVNVDVSRNSLNCGVPYLLYNSNDETAERLGYTIDKNIFTHIQSIKYTSANKNNDYYVSNGLEVTTLEEMEPLLLKSISENKKVIFFRVSDTINREELISKATEIFINELGDTAKDVKGGVHSRYAGFTY